MSDGKDTSRQGADRAQELLLAVEDLIGTAYLVGGSLRDVLLGRDPVDFDFATPLAPDGIEARIRDAGKRPYLIGKRFGTVGCKIDGTFVEITTFRRDEYAPANRKPEVAFDATLEQDLSRRDFTINAMAQDSNGHIIDLFDGMDDIEAKRIRSVGDAAMRFDEDPLRMLRAARFASQLSFGIEDRTLEAMCKQAATILHVSRERWTKELDLLLMGASHTSGLTSLLDTGLLGLMIPELLFGVDSGATKQHLPVLDVGFAEDDPLEKRWALLFGETRLPFLADGLANDAEVCRSMRLGFIEKVGTYLHWSKKRIAATQSYV